jgi:hypothetical protein
MDRLSFDLFLRLHLIGCLACGRIGGEIVLIVVVPDARVHGCRIIVGRKDRSLRGIGLRQRTGWKGVVIHGRGSLCSLKW